VSPLVIIFVTVFIDLLGFGIIIPLLPFYAEHFGASALAVGLLSTSYSVAQFLFAPLWGRLSDRIGRRPVILVGLLGSAASYVLFATAGSLAMLFIARTLGGIAGANIPTAQAFIADITPPDQRARGMGLVGAAFGLGFVFGPAAGGFLSQWGYSAPAWFAAALSAANFAAALMLLPESLAEGDRARERRPGRLATFRQALERPHLPVVLAVYFLVVAAFSGFESMFALFGSHQFGLTAVSIGYVFALVGIVLAVVQGLVVAPLVKRTGERRLVPAALFVLTIGLALVPLSGSVPMLTGASVVIALGMGLNSPAMMAVISQLADPRWQGGTLGVSQALGSLARIVGPASGGWIFDRFGREAPFFAAAGLMLVACVLSAAGFRQPNHGGEEPAEVRARQVP
jgi:DHA1 family tetracycline resistance protein-like MFS transporter